MMKELLIIGAIAAFWCGESDASKPLTGYDKFMLRHGKKSANQSADKPANQPANEPAYQPTEKPINLPTNEPSYRPRNNSGSEQQTPNHQAEFDAKEANSQLLNKNRNDNVDLKTKRQILIEISNALQGKNLGLYADGLPEEIAKAKRKESGYSKVEAEFRALGGPSIWGSEGRPLSEVKELICNYIDSIQQKN